MTALPIGVSKKLNESGGTGGRVRHDCSTRRGGLGVHSRHLGSIDKLSDAGLHSESRSASIDKDAWVNGLLVGLDNLVESILDIGRGLEVGRGGSGLDRVGVGKGLVEGRGGDLGVDEVGRKGEVD
jgi:hypothetical protein